MNSEKTDQYYVQIEEMAKLLITPAEIGVMIGDSQFADKLMDEETPEYMAYMKGKLKIKMEINKSILQLAKQGSGPAQTMALQLLIDQEMEEQ